MRLLRRGDLAVTGRLADASNLSLVGTVTLDGVSMDCVYKPVRGERPLWDFPDGTLAQREVAAYRISRMAGWDCVPPTVLRAGPFGDGMVQQWVNAEEYDDLVDLLPARALPASLAAGAAGPRRARAATWCWPTPTTRGSPCSPPSTWWSTTPIARPRTSCPPRTAGCTGSTTG